LGSIEVTAGARAAMLTNMTDEYVMNGKVYLDPRANAGYTFPRFTLLGKATTIRVSGGVGQHTKMPTMEQLFPDMLYLDFIQLNYYHDNPDYRCINVMTYVRNPRNTALEPARNLKWEVAADLSIGGNRMSVTLFREKMSSGFRSQAHYDTYTYRQYDASAIDGQALTAKPTVADLPYTETSELGGYSNYTNGSMTLKEGVEYTFEKAVSLVVTIFPYSSVTVVSAADSLVSVGEVSDTATLVSGAVVSSTGSGMFVVIAVG
jgi:hypothetical protein